jgi:hypothetical protein
VFTFLGGVILLVSGATPAATGRLAMLHRLMPLGFIEASHFLGSVIGALLLLLSQGLARRLDAAYYFTIVAIAAGMVASLLKGIDYATKRSCSTSAEVAKTSSGEILTETLTVPTFGRVVLYAPVSEPDQVVLFISGDGGWNLGVVAMAERLRDLGALVLGSTSAPSSAVLKPHQRVRTQPVRSKICRTRYRFTGSCAPTSRPYSLAIRLVPRSSTPRSLVRRPRRSQAQSVWDSVPISKSTRRHARCAD